MMQVELTNLPGHVLERLDKHFDAICTKITAIKHTLHGSQRSLPAERCVMDRLADVEAKLRTLDEALRGSDAGRASNAAVATEPAAASSAGGGDVQSILVSTSEKMIIYEGVITVLNREVEKLSTQVWLTLSTFSC